MRKYILMLSLVLCACASTKPSMSEVTTVTVTSEGKTLEQAKQKGFEKAVEIAVGSVVLYYSEARNKKLVRDEIISHSSGYVDNYVILSQVHDSHSYNIVMDVTVRNSKIAQRLLNVQNASDNFNGDKLNTQFQTYVDQRQTGDKVIESVLRDYPKYAFSIEKNVVKNQTNIYREPVISITYSIKYNHKYVEALNEALKIVSDKKDNNIVQENIQVIYKKPENLLFGKTYSYHFNDVYRSNLIKQTFMDRLYLYTIFKDNSGNIIVQGCDEGMHWNSINPTNPFIINANREIEGEMVVTLRKSAHKISQFNEVELKLDNKPCTIID